MMKGDYTRTRRRLNRPISRFLLATIILASSSSSSVQAIPLSALHVEPLAAHTEHEAFDYRSEHLGVLLRQNATNSAHQAYDMFPWWHVYGLGSIALLGAGLMVWGLFVTKAVMVAVAPTQCIAVSPLCLPNYSVATTALCVPRQYRAKFTRHRRTTHKASLSDDEVEDDWSDENNNNNGDDDSSLSSQEDGDDFVTERFHQSFPQTTRYSRRLAEQGLPLSSSSLSLSSSLSSRGRLTSLSQRKRRPVDISEHADEDVSESFSSDLLYGEESWHGTTATASYRIIEAV